MPNHELV